MKFLSILFLVIALPSISNSQKLILPIDSSTKAISYNEVVPLQGITKDQLYVRAREWFAQTFKSAQAVIQMDDKEAGKIIGKGSAKGSFYYLLTLFSFSLNYTVSITLKDGRYRYEITDFTATDDGAKYMYNLNVFATAQEYKNKKGEYKEAIKGYLVSTNQTGTALAESIKNALNKSGVKSKDDF